MAQLKSFTVDTEVKVYFCDPQSTWQRGSNENANGLLRQYFPKRTSDLSAYSQEELDEVALRLNQRPRKTLGFQTPASKCCTDLLTPPDFSGLGVQTRRLRKKSANFDKITSASTTLE
jgi:IS30 family transposase